MPSRLPGDLQIETVLLSFGRFNNVIDLYGSGLNSDAIAKAVEAGLVEVEEWDVGLSGGCELRLTKKGKVALGRGGLLAHLKRMLRRIFVDHRNENPLPKN